MVHDLSLCCDSFALADFVSFADMRGGEPGDISAHHPLLLLATQTGGREKEAQGGPSLELAGALVSVVPDCHPADPGPWHSWPCVPTPCGCRPGSLSESPALGIVRRAKSLLRPAPATLLCIPPSRKEARGSPRGFKLSHQGLCLYSDTLVWPTSCVLNASQI